MVYKAPLGLLVTNQPALDADPLGDVEPEYVLWEREKGDGDEASVGSGAAAGGSGSSTTAGSSAAGSVAGSAAGSPSFAPASSSSGTGAQSSGPSHATPFSPSSSPPVVSLSAASSPTSSAAAIAALVSSRRALLSTKPPKYLRELRPGVVQLVQPILMDDRGGHAHHGHGAASAATVSSSSEGEGNTFFTFQIIQHPNNTKCVSHTSHALQQATRLCLRCDLAAASPLPFLLLVADCPSLRLLCLLLVAVLLQGQVGVVVDPLRDRIRVSHVDEADRESHHGGGDEKTLQQIRVRGPFIIARRRPCCRGRLHLPSSDALTLTPLRRTVLTM